MVCVFFGGSGWRSDSLPYSFVYQDDAKSSESSGRVHRCLQEVAGPASFWSSPDCICRRRKVRHSVVVRNFWTSHDSYLNVFFKVLTVRSIVLRQPCSYFGSASSMSQDSVQQGIPFFGLPKVFRKLSMSKRTWPMKHIFAWQNSGGPGRKRWDGQSGGSAFAGQGSNYNWGYPFVNRDGCI